MTDDEKLIEMMAIKADGGMYVEAWIPHAKAMLSVIRQNVHMVAKVCPECFGGWKRNPYGCSCKGHGVIPK